jgi:hypothetical protein
MAYYLDGNPIVWDGETPFAGSDRVTTEPPVVIPTPPAPFDVSKLSLRRALRAIGLEGALNAFIAANPTAKADWDDATILRTASKRASPPSRRRRSWRVAAPNHLPSPAPATPSPRCGGGYQQRIPA